MDFDFRAVEAKWQRYWSEQRLFTTNPKPSKKYYVLVMYPYPSGDLHMGHTKNYVIGDVVARFKKLQGCDVLHPFGWDAFGLPAENAAIERGVDPESWTMENIRVSRASLQAMGIGYDWDAEVTTCRPDYYRWTQWLFLKFFERGLAFRKESYVNWCTGCQTVLANEQVKDGRCYRSSCNSPVEKRKLTQWYFRITDYAESLLAGLDTLPHWPENVKAMQRHWIGKSLGTAIDFRRADTGAPLTVFTTRPDTLYGCTFMAIAPESPLAEEFARGDPRLAEFIAQAVRKPEIERSALGGEKQGIFTGRAAVNPVNGEAVPIWIADYVLASYGTGAVMCVPAHDQRDFEFARAHDIPVRAVIMPPGTTLDGATMTEAYTEPGVMANSGPFDGTTSIEGIDRVTDYLAEKKQGRRMVNYRLKDWLLSRQRYWGAPIPMIHCPHCGIVPVPEQDLPVLLPKGQIDFIPKGRSPLAMVEEFMAVTCPTCGGPARRDPDTMDTFVDSSWYFLRYLDPKNERAPFTLEKTKTWLPVDHYIGGIEHATGHLVFSRFFTHVLYDAGLVAVKEYCDRLTTHGMVQLDGKTMSSSKRHGIWVGPFIEQHGADVARITMLFAAPPEKDLEWSDDAVVAAERFLGRVWRLVQANAGTGLFTRPDVRNLNPDDRRLYVRLNQTVKKVTDDTEQFGFNTAIAGLMELMNDLGAHADKATPVYRFAVSQLVVMLAPFAPHLADEAYNVLGGSGSLLERGWVEHDPSALTFATMTIPVQVNGRLRATVDVPVDASQAEIEQAARSDARVKEHTRGKTVTRVIYVPGRLVSIVAA